eukprot:15449481-Alexandrium_andersonii.AAC.1
MAMLCKMRVVSPSLEPGAVVQHTTSLMDHHRVGATLASEPGTLQAFDVSYAVQADPALVFRVTNITL